MTEPMDEPRELEYWSPPMRERRAKGGFGILAGWMLVQPLGWFQEIRVWGTAWGLLAMVLIGVSSVVAQIRHFEMDGTIRSGCTVAALVLVLSVRRFLLRPAPQVELYLRDRHHEIFLDRFDPSIPAHMEVAREKVEQIFKEHDAAGMRTKTLVRRGKSRDEVVFDGNWKDVRTVVLVGMKAEEAG